MKIDIIDRPSPNFDTRAGAIDMLLLHYTGMRSGEAALDRLCDPAAKVSAHYLIEEDGRVFQMVDEADRAWHAGRSRWAGETDINSCSVGVEIVNPGHEFGYRLFPPEQISVCIELCRGILMRHDITRYRVLGHSDVAPRRKEDPGELFPWQKLWMGGVGFWPSPAFAPEQEGTQLGLGDRGAMTRQLRDDLAAFGYGLSPGERFDDATAATVRAFQRHWRQSRVDGIADPETRAILQHLLARLPG